MATDWVRASPDQRSHWKAHGYVASFRYHTERLSQIAMRLPSECCQTHQTIQNYRELPRKVDIALTVGYHLAIQSEARYGYRELRKPHTLDG